MADPKLMKRMASAREQSDQAFQLIRPNSLYERPIPERHRIIFYLGHLEAFDWNLLQPRLAGTQSSNSELDRLFAFGIDPVDGGLPSDQPSDWPSENRVRDYNARVRADLDKALEYGPWGGAESPETILNVAIEHRLMHVETLAYMLHQLPLEAKAGIQQAAIPSIGALHREMVEIPAGRATLGIDANSFGWDNEFQIQEVDVPPFLIDKFKITNGEFLNFIRADGYQERSFWTEAGWRWKESEGISHPIFWRPDGDRWLYRAMFDEIPLPMNWPVYVSHAEASAYAAWAGKRLPTEPEWHRAAFGDNAGTERSFPWGGELAGSRHGYFGLTRWDPSPVDAFPNSRSAFGVVGLLANGWEWTSSLFEPLPGFQAFSFYPGYSANFYDGLHYVMKGGSPRTEECMLRRSFRNWFQPHYQYVYAGFRCAK